MPGAEYSHEFPELSSGHAVPGNNATVTAPNGTKHVTKVSQSGLHITHGAINIHLIHWPAIDRR